MTDQQSLDQGTWQMVLETADGYFERNDRGLAEELHLAGIAAEVAPDPARWGELMRRQGLLAGTSGLLDMFATGAASERELGVVLPLPPSEKSPVRQFCDRMEVDGLISSRDVRVVLVANDCTAFAVPVDRLDVTGLIAMDSDAGWVRARGTVSAKDVTTVEATNWPDIRSRAGVALAWELAGLAERVLRVTTEHVTSREQFGAPLTQFQSLRHRIVGAEVDIRAALDALANVDAAEDLSWMTAKALSGRAARRACATAQQLCGAMGFTWEFDLHRCVRRILTLDALLGDHQTMTQRIGGQLISRQSVPRLSELPELPAVPA